MVNMLADKTEAGRDITCTNKRHITTPLHLGKLHEFTSVLTINTKEKDSHEYFAFLNAQKASSSATIGFMFFNSIAVLESWWLYIFSQLLNLEAESSVSQVAWSFSSTTVNTSGNNQISRYQNYLAFDMCNSRCSSHQSKKTICMTGVWSFLSGPMKPIATGLMQLKRWGWIVIINLQHQENYLKSR